MDVFLLLSSHFSPLWCVLHLICLFFLLLCLAVTHGLLSNTLWTQSWGVNHRVFHPKFQNLKLKLLIFFVFASSCSSKMFWRQWCVHCTLIPKQHRLAQSKIRACSRFLCESSLQAMSTTQDQPQCIVITTANKKNDINTTAMYIFMTGKIARRKRNARFVDFTYNVYEPSWSPGFSLNNYSILHLCKM